MSKSTPLENWEKIESAAKLIEAAGFLQDYTSPKRSVHSAFYRKHPVLPGYYIEVHVQASETSGLCVEKRVRCGYEAVSVTGYCNCPQKRLLECTQRVLDAPTFFADISLLLQLKALAEGRNPSPLLNKCPLEALFATSTDEGRRQYEEARKIWRKIINIGS